MQQVTVPGGLESTLLRQGMEKADSVVCVNDARWSDLLEDATLDQTSFEHDYFL